MLCCLSFWGASAVSFSRWVNRLRALCSHRHRSPRPVSLPTTNWPSAKGQTSALLLCPSPAPFHPLFVHFSPHCYLRHPSHIPLSPAVSKRVIASSISSLPSSLWLSFVSSSPLFFCRPSLSCQCCLQPCIINWTKLLWVWPRSGSGSTRLNPAHYREYSYLSVLPPRSSFYSLWV